MLTAAPAARAPLLDLDSCHDDLDRLHRTASDASDAAEDANSKHEEFENCRQDSSLDRGCGSERSEYESAIGDLESDLDDVDSRLQSVQDSCGYEFSINRISAADASQRRLENARRRLCTSLKQLVALGMTPEKALEMCKTNTNEQWCKACLGTK